MLPYGIYVAAVTLAFCLWQDAEEVFVLNKNKDLAFHLAGVRQPVKGH